MKSFFNLFLNTNASVKAKIISPIINKFTYMFKLFWPTFFAIRADAIVTKKYIASPSNDLINSAAKIIS